VKRTARTFMKRLLRDKDGALIVEAAMLVSVLTTLSLSGLEIARYALLHQKMERVAASIGDLVAQAETLSETDIANILAAVEHVARPFDVAVNGRVMISSIGATGSSPPAIYWQRIGAGSYAATSKVGTPGGTVALPAGFSVAAGDTVIATEVVYRYTPWVFPELVGTTEVYHSAWFRPRFGALTQID
jgi:Flp pilus assembly protein TadG